MRKASSVVSTDKRIVLVTGGVGGIGSALCGGFLKEGYIVVCSDISIKEWRKENDRLYFAPLDVSNEDSVSTLFEELTKRLGRLDVLVNNAGISKPKQFLEISKKDWDLVLSVNLTGTFMCSKEASKIFIEQKGGKIINISSFRGLSHCSNSSNLHYAVSKAGVVSLTKGLAKELAPYVTVNAVAPGYVETPMIASWTTERRECEIKKTPIGRLLNPKEIADAVIFLASEKADAITGEILVVDGGYSIL